MATRRELLKLGMAILGGVLGAGKVIKTSAQEPGVVGEMFESQPWLEPVVFDNFRRLSSALIELRIVYAGPNGYEGEEEFRSGVWELWESVFDRAFQDGYVGIKEMASDIDAGEGKDLRTQMTDLLEKNGDQFIGWLEGLGIQAGSKLQIDLLRSQAFFALAAGAQVANWNLDRFRNVTWVYPFC